MKEKGDFHVDMSGRIYEGRTVGVVIVGTDSGINYGCAIKSNLIKFVKKHLFEENIYNDAAKLYGIIISLLIQTIEEKIKTLIVCNDEDFKIVKETIEKLIENKKIEIINIGEFRKRFGRNIGSLADNYSRIYRRRALKKNRQIKGRRLNIVEINFNLIKQKWEKIKRCK